MEQEFIFTHIRHICIRIILLTLIPLAILLLAFFRMPYNEIFYPLELTYVNSANSAYSSGTEYVEVTLNQVIYTGYDCTLRGRRQGSYYYSLVNNSCTFVLVDTSRMANVPATLDNHKITAKLTALDDQAISMMQQYAQDINWTLEGLQSVTSNVIIDETAYDLNLYVYLLVMFFCMIILIVIILLIHSIYLLAPWLYPACTNFYKIKTTKHEIASIDQELYSKIIHKFSNTILTEHYLVTFTPFRLEIVPLKKMIWTYSHTGFHGFAHFHTKLTYTMHMFCKKKIRVSAKLKKQEELDSIMEYLQQQHPQIMFGYSKEHKRKAKKKWK